MAGKFVEIVDAAKMLGVSAEELKEMRSRGEIFGYRDGASWKFKLEEVERVMGERQDMPHSDSAILSANDEEFDNLISGLSSTIQKERQESEGRDSILLSDDVLGPTGASPSTIIGKGLKGQTAGDSDLTLASESQGLDSFVAGGASSKSGHGSDVLGDPELQVSSGSKTGELPKSAATSGVGDELSLGDDLILDDSASSISKKGLSAKDLDLDLTLADSQVGKAGMDDSGLLDDSSLELGEEMSVLGAESPTGKGSHKSGKGSDVTLNTGTSGINLAPSDSGIGLDEEPLELGGSIDDSLELPEDNDIISLEEEAADPDQATRLKRDDQFMLAPAGAHDDEEDSGSQVIALEDSSFDQDAATMLGQGNLVAPALVPEDPFAQAQVVQPGVGGFDPTMAAMPGDMSGMPMPGMQPQMAGMAAPGMAPVYAPAPVEMPYSIWNVVSLMVVAGVLALTGMLMVDVMHNMWQFDGNGTASSAIMDGFIGMFGLDR